MKVSKLKLCRLSLGLKAKEIAAQIGISPAYLCQIENRVNPATQEIIIKLAKIYEVDLKELV